LLQRHFSSFNPKEPALAIFYIWKFSELRKTKQQKAKSPSCSMEKPKKEKAICEVTQRQSR